MSPAHAQDPRGGRETLPALTDRLPLGVGLEVSPFCLGLVADPRTIPAAFDAGINFFFVTADMHWPLYQATRDGLAMLLARGTAIRDQIVVAGASYATQPEFCTAPFEELRDAIAGLERLDVLVAGGAYGYELERRLPIYRGHRDHAWCGARAIGTSFHDRSAAIAPARTGALDLCLVRYNAGHLGARDDLFPHLADRRALVYNFKNTTAYVSPARCDQLGLDPDMWRPSVTDHYRFVLSRAELDGVLCALDTPAHVSELADAIAEGPLADEEQDHLVLLAKLASGRSELVR